MQEASSYGEYLISLESLFMPVVLAQRENFPFCGRLAIPGDIFGFHKLAMVVLLSSLGEEPRIMLNILCCTGQPLTTGYLAKMSILPRFINAGLYHLFLHMFTLLVGSLFQVLSNVHHNHDH